MRAIVRGNARADERATAIVATASSTETIPTNRAAPAVPGKFSRVMPRNDTSTAQAANRPPKTW